IGIDRSVRQSARSVTANSVAAEALYAEYDVVSDEPTSARAHTAAFFGRVVSPRCRRQAGAKRIAGHKLHAWEDAIGEPGKESIDFVVTKARIESDLGNDVGRGVERVGRRAVIALTVATLAQQEVTHVSVGGHRRLRILDRDRDGNLVIEVLG